MKGRIQSFICYGVLGLYCAFMAQGLATAQDGGAAANQQADGSRSAAVGPEYSSLSIIRIANHDAGATRDITLEYLENVEGEDVQIEGWALSAGLPIWIIVNASGTRTWRAYGPAKEEEGGIWKVNGVQFGEGSHQGRYFRVRAVALRQAPAKTELSSKEWQDIAEVISPPVRVTVESRNILGQQAPGIWISTIDNETVDPQNPTVVQPSASISGTFRLPEREDQSPAASKPVASGAEAQGNRPLILVVVHAPATDSWRVSGRAEISESKWEIRDLIISNLGEPYQDRFELFAVISRKEMKPGPVSYDTWWENVIVASPSIKVATPLAKDLPEINITKLVNRDGETDRPESATLENIIGVEGEVTSLPGAASVWLLINPIGSQMWIVHGPAIVRGKSWVLPLTRLTRLGNNQSSHFRFMAMVSTNTVLPGLTDYNTWRRDTISVSPIWVIKNGASAGQRSPSATTLSITSFAGIAVTPDSTEQVPNSGDIQGAIEGLPQNAFVWAAIHELDTQNWIIKGPALIRDDQWVLPDVVLAKSGEAGAKTEKKRFEIAAVVTDFSFAVDHIDLSELLFYAQTISPLIHVVDGPDEEAFEGQTGLRRIPIMTWLLVIAIVALLVVLEYLFAMISAIAGLLANAFESLVAHIRQKLPWLDNRSYGVLSILGVAILGLGLLAIYNYFPIYSHVLESLFSLPPKVSRGLAMILIIFVGLAGVLLDLTNSYGGRPVEDFNHSTNDEDKWPNRAPGIANKKRTGTQALSHLFSVILLSLVTLTLWTFQGIVYLKFYMSTAVDPLVAFALGGAAFFIAGIETLGFYWATHFGIEIMAWILVSIFLIAPPLILAKAFRALELIFQSLPSRARASAQPRDGSNWVIRSGVAVFAEDERIGQVESVSVGSNGKGAQSISVNLRRDVSAEGRVEIPVDWVKIVEPQRVVLHYTKDEIAARIKKNLKANKASP